MYQAINHGLRIALKNDPAAGNEISKIFSPSFIEHSMKLLSEVHTINNPSHYLLVVIN